MRINTQIFNILRIHLNTKASNSSLYGCTFWWFWICVRCVKLWSHCSRQALGSWPRRGDDKARLLGLENGETWAALLEWHQVYWGLYYHGHRPVPFHDFMLFVVLSLFTGGSPNIERQKDSAFFKGTSREKRGCNK